MQTSKIWKFLCCIDSAFEDLGVASSLKTALISECSPMA